MYRIMLTDDEGIVLNSLTLILEKNFENVFEIETAKSGRAAIEIAEHFRPDVIFMDIQMPGINGIDAMREIQKFLPNVIFVVLTAYDKFDYAKEAINLGVLEYLNKPFNQKMVVDVINQAVKELDERRERRHKELQTKERLETVVPIIENGFIYSIIFQERFEEDIENYKNLLGLDGDHGYMMVVVFGDSQQANHMTNNVGISVKAQTIYYNKVREILKDAFPGAIVGSVTGNKIPIFVPSTDEQLDIHERSEIIEKSRVTARMMKNATDDTTYRIGIGSVGRLKDSLNSYEEAIKALYSTTGSVAHVDDLPIAVSYEESYPVELEEAIFEKLGDGKADDCGVVAGKFFDWMEEKYSNDMMSVKLKALEFVLRAESDMYRSGGHTYTFDSRKNYLTDVMSANDMTTLKAWYLDKIKKAATNISTGSTDHTHHVIKKAIDYIENNFSKDISLDEISQELNLSSYYFSKLFKEEKGEGFVEYLNSRRISEAKELMKNQEKSIKEISNECGYADPNYFSRIFKKYTGMTPTEYRDKCGNGM
ncbi:MAG: AraC family transcriptional regulator [Lachnospiraceae bacterium]|nr:AraC family transcriptional regulator [Candidatus Colinaster scatohippi]